MSRYIYPNGEPAGEEHECNDCGITIPLWRPICTLCERWYEERGLPLPGGLDEVLDRDVSRLCAPENAPAIEPQPQRDANQKGSEGRR